MPKLPSAFLHRPLAHRGRHGPGVPENSRAAILRAVREGYGIEIDIQLSADGHAVVFHDYDLKRLAGRPGPIRQCRVSDLSRMTLMDTPETIPTLADILSLVSGHVPLLVEIKDQDGAMGPNVGPLETAAASALEGYIGPVAVMSFNPHSVAAMARLAPEVPRGLTTSAYRPADWPTLPAATRDALREIPDYARTGSSFISHEAADLHRPRVAALKAQGAKVLCWTVRSPQGEVTARDIADNITFEGYDA